MLKASLYWIGPHRCNLNTWLIQKEDWHTFEPSTWYNTSKDRPLCTNAFSRKRLERNTAMAFSVVHTGG